MSCIAACIWPCSRCRGRLTCRLYIGLLIFGSRISAVGLTLPESYCRPRHTCNHAHSRQLAPVSMFAHASGWAFVASLLVWVCRYGPLVGVFVRSLARSLYLSGLVNCYVSADGQGLNLIRAPSVVVRSATWPSTICQRTPGDSSLQLLLDSFQRVMRFTCNCFCCVHPSRSRATSKTLWSSAWVRGSLLPGKYENCRPHLLLPFMPWLCLSIYGSRCCAFFPKDASLLQRRFAALTCSRVAFSTNWVFSSESNPRRLLRGILEKKASWKA